MTLASGRRAELLIGGDWVAADGGGRFAVTSPATGETVGECPAAGAAETRRAIDAAHAALEGWSALGAAGRGEILNRCADLLTARREEIATLIAMEGAKPIEQSRGEVDYATGFLRFYAEEAAAALAATDHPHPAGKRVRSVPRPAGVCGLITIWNFPAAGITRPLGAALAAGCTAVVKPAEQTPLTAVAVMESMVEAGLPAGVANLITAADPTPVGRELTTDERVRKLSFTGSARVGTSLLRDAAAEAKHVTLELGGHAPLIVLADADVELAVEGATLSKFRNSGQTCVCLNRIYVEPPAYEEFRDRFAERVEGLRAGDPLDPGTDVGPLIDRDALDRVETHVADAVGRGADLLTGGSHAEGPGGEAGLLYEPTVLAGVSPDSLIMSEETFGPVAPIAPVASEAEAVERSNALPWGLAAYVYSADRERAAAMAARLEYGVVGINDPLPAAPHLPFGGVKRSGLGKEGGRAGIEEFLETQLVSEAP